MQFLILFLIQYTRTNMSTINYTMQTGNSLRSPLTVIPSLSAVAKPHCEEQRSDNEQPRCELTGEDHRRLHARSHGVGVSASVDRETGQPAEQETASGDGVCRPARENRPCLQGRGRGV